MYSTQILSVLSPIALVEIKTVSVHSIYQRTKTYKMEIHKYVNKRKSVFLRSCAFVGVYWFSTNNNTSAFHVTVCTCIRLTRVQHM